MRLFIAINFDNKTKDALCGAIQAAKSGALKGNFTRRENLHLTLVFIGETTRADLVKKAMDKIDASPFTLEIGGAGRFRRNGGDILWAGIEKNDELSSIYKKLRTELANYGFEIEQREYKPHLTLGREVVFTEGFDGATFGKEMPKLQVEVSKITLMKSERIDGKLTYTGIFEKTLQ